MTRLNKSKESDLKAAISERLQYLENQLDNFYWDRLNSGEILTLNQNGTKRLIKLCRPGTADLYFVFKGKLYYLETKKLKGKQRETQIEFQNKVEKAGAVYFLVDNYEDFEGYLKIIGIKGFGKV